MKKTILFLLVPLLNGMAPPLSNLQGRLASELGRHEVAIRSLAPLRDSWSQLWLAHSDYSIGKNQEAILLWRSLLSDPEVGSAASIALARHAASLRELQALLDQYQDFREREPEKGDWEGLAAKLEEYSGREAGNRNSLRAKVVRAEILESLGKESSFLLGEIAACEGILGDWAKVRLAEKGDRPSLDFLIKANSPLASSAMLAWAKKNKSLELLEKLSQEKAKPEAEEAAFLLSREKKSPENYRFYRKNFPNGPHFSEVSQALADFDLSAEEKSEIGLSLYKRGEYGKAARLLSGISSSRARYYYGRALWQGGDPASAEKWIRGLLGDSEFKQKALITLGQILEDLKKTGAGEAYRKASLFDNSLSCDALSLLARFHRRSDRIDSALKVESELIGRFPRSQEAADAGWKRFWHSRDPGALENLLKHFPNGPQGARAAYWLGKTNGNPSRSPEHYRKAAAWDEKGFYGFRARQALARLEGKNLENPFDTGGFLEAKAVRPEWSAGLPPEEASLIAGEGKAVTLPPAGGELFFLRQHKDIERLAKEKSLIGWLKALQGDHGGAIRNNGGKPHLLYPLGYRPFLLEACREKKLNPLLLAALVREESRFDPRAISPVGAVGLAQLMPSTAKGMDGLMGELKNRPLTDPRANLGRGAIYLAYSRSCFPGRDYLSVAGYNAGTGAVKGWTTRFAGILDDPDCFIESIPYRETRDYVRRVFASFWNYRELYVGTNP